MTKRLWHTPSPDKLFKERCSGCDAVRRRLRDRSRPRWREHPIYKVRWHRYGIPMPYCPGGKPSLRGLFATSQEAISTNYLAVGENGGKR